MAFFKNLSLQRLWHGASSTFLRFPLVLLSAFAGTAAAIYQLELSYEQREQNPWLEKVIFLSAVGLILFFTLELLTRKYDWARLKRWISWFGGLAFLVLYYWLLPEDLEERDYVRLLALLLVLHLTASYAMFINRQVENAFWQFNKSLFLRIFTAVLYTGVLYLGLAVALVALDQLFSINIDGEVYGQLWFILVGVFNTWFFLAGVPLDVAELEQAHTYPKGLKVFTQFVLLPLVTIYLLILYAYLGKIIVQWAWPEGWVSVLVLCFSIAGILSLLLIYPIRHEEGNAWIRTFSKWFYRALFPLIILLSLAIWRRVSEYGITEERYIVLVLALWLFLTALYFLFSTVKNIKFIPITLSIIAFIAAFGPVNMFKVSEWSQVNRLRGLLVQEGILVKGKIEPGKGNVPEASLVEISAITDYLARHHDFEGIEDWFTVDINKVLENSKINRQYAWQNKTNMRDAVLEQMGLEYTIKSSSPERYFSFGLSNYETSNEVFAISGYEYAVEAHLHETYHKQDLTLGKTPLVLTLDKQELYLAFEKETLRLDLAPIIKKLATKEAYARSQTELTYTLKGHQAEVKVILRELSGVREKADNKIQNLRVLLLVRLEP
ncbi:DUF4153 domain-containing protein [Pontibacter oryzae]|uniref:DUF4153 domain-containing protein n=1 Tax=Pontibacter oryzae TaxID=2304593 RepID=A0A399SLS1_9BACT|nr:DUF4153 domain-containing protein [Pontibacter oryzae]RIJ42907.1 DUF4153 domain-containing protein [Pontibacter oryzae]